VWRALLPAAAAAGAPGALAAALEALRRATGPWVVLLSSGGHFAAAVFSPNSNPAAGAAPARASGTGEGGRAGRADAAGAAAGAGNAPAAGGSAAPGGSGGGGGGGGGGASAPLDVLAHKTVHRYVVRCLTSPGARQPRHCPVFPASPGGIRDCVCHCICEDVGKKISLAELERPCEPPRCAG